MELAMILLRLVAGLAVAAHGAQKLFGSFGGGGLSGTRSFFTGLGFRTPCTGDVDGRARPDQICCNAVRGCREGLAWSCV